MKALLLVILLPTVVYIGAHRDFTDLKGEKRTPVLQRGGINQLPGRFRREVNPTPSINDYLPFLDLGSTAGVLTVLVNDTSIVSEAIPIEGGFPFGVSVQDVVHVVTNGYFSFGAPVVDGPQPFPGSHTFLIAPFWVDNSENAAIVHYEVHTNGSNATSPLAVVSAFICDQLEVDFFGQWLLVAEWNHIPEQPSNVSNTFQGILVTDGTTSYAIFTYNCGSMQLSDFASIGFHANDTFFINHPLSGSSDANEIACLNAPGTLESNVIYTLGPGSCRAAGYSTCCSVGDCLGEPGNCYCDQTCYSIEDCCEDAGEVCVPVVAPSPTPQDCSPFDFLFTCGSGECIPAVFECDGIIDCVDESDEITCVTPTTTIVSRSLASPPSSSGVITSTAAMASPPTSTRKDDGALSGGAIAGIIIAVLVAVLIFVALMIALIVYIFLRTRSKTYEVDRSLNEYATEKNKVFPGAQEHPIEQKQINGEKAPGDAEMTGKNGATSKL